MEGPYVPISHEPQKHALNKRIEDIGWALFLILIGGLWLLPNQQVPESTWLIGAGLILLGVNGARYLNGLKMSGFTVILGMLALIAGAASIFGLKLPLFAILLLLLGVSILLKPLTKTQSS